MSTTKISAQEAYDAVLAGRTVKIVVGHDPEDPILLNYLDRCLEFDHEPMIYTEAIGGWSSGTKEAVCEPESDFYIKFVSDVAEIAITDEIPPQREAQESVVAGSHRDS